MADAAVVGEDRARTGGNAGAADHHFTVDVEEYFQVTAFASIVPAASWESYESRVDASMDCLLELLDRHAARGTFFVLGWLAERRPHIVRRIADAGHEVASHGWDHRLVHQQTVAEFRQSVRASKALLEQLSGAPVTGFRAPSFSIIAGCEWALDTLIDEGYRYDSSLFPIRRPGYGYATARREPHWLERPDGRLFEFPPTTLRRFGYNMPAAGGAYFRLFPYALTAAALRQAERDGRQATFYLHPWEVDPGQPRLAVGPATRVRHYGGLNRTVRRLDRLFGEFRFRRTMSEVVACS